MPSVCRVSPRHGTAQPVPWRPPVPLPQLKPPETPLAFRCAGGRQARAPTQPLRVGGLLGWQWPRLAVAVASGASCCAAAAGGAGRVRRARVDQVRRHQGGSGCQVAREDRDAPPRLGRALALAAYLCAEEAAFLVTVVNKRVNNEYKGFTANLVKDAFDWDDDFMQKEKRPSFQV